MISTELLRRYPFFAGLNDDYMATLAKSAVEYTVDEGHCFFPEGGILDHFYLVLEGTIAIVIEIPDRDEVQTLTRQLTGNLKNRDVTVSTVRPGNINRPPARKRKRLVEWFPSIVKNFAQCVMKITNLVI